MNEFIIMIYFSFRAIALATLFACVMGDSLVHGDGVILPDGMRVPPLDAELEVEREFIMSIQRDYSLKEDQIGRELRAISLGVRLHRQVAIFAPDESPIPVVSIVTLDCRNDITLSRGDDQPEPLPPNTCRVFLESGEPWPINLLGALPKQGVAVIRAGGELILMDLGLPVKGKPRMRFLSAPWPAEVHEAETASRGFLGIDFKTINARIEELQRRQMPTSAEYYLRLGLACQRADVDFVPFKGEPVAVLWIGCVFREGDLMIRRSRAGKVPLINSSIMVFDAQGKLLPPPVTGALPEDGNVVVITDDRLLCIRTGPLAGPRMGISRVQFGGQPRRPVDP